MHPDHHITSKLIQLYIEIGNLPETDDHTTIIHKPLEELGLSTVDQIKFLVKIQNDFNVKFSEHDFIKINTIHDTVNFIKENTETTKIVTGDLIQSAQASNNGKSLRPLKFFPKIRAKIREKITWTKLRFAHRINYALMREDRTMVWNRLEILFGMAAFFNIKNNKRIALAKRNQKEEHFFTEYLFAENNNHYFIEPQKHFPVTRSQIAKFLDIIPSPVMVNIFQNAAWMFVISQIALLILENKNIKLSFFGNVDEKLLMLLRRQAELVFNLPWSKINEEEYINIVRYDALNASRLILKGIVRGDILIFFDDMQTYDKPTFVETPLLKSNIILSTAFLDLAMLTNTPIMPLGFTFKRNRILVNHDSPYRLSREELSEKNVSNVSMLINRLQLTNLNKNPEQWLQWAVIAKNSPIRELFIGDNTPLLNEKLHVAMPIGSFFIVGHIYTQRTIQIPIRVMKCLRKATNAADFLEHIKKLRFAYPIQQALVIIEILSGKLPTEA